MLRQARHERNQQFTVNPELVGLDSHSRDILRKQAITWLLRVKASHCTEGERRDFENWLAENPKHRQTYEAIQAQWDWMEQFKTRSFPARTAALSYRKKSLRPLFAYSAVAALALAVGLAAVSPDGWYGSSEIYRVAKGDKQIIHLADGSTMELNTDSEARVRFNHWQRNVELLRGEAFFTVTHNAERPFEVRAGNGRVRDTGTAFEVYIQPGQVVVAVQEGSVEVQTIGKQTLSVGQQLSFNRNGDLQTLPDQNISGLTAWRQGKMVFHARRLDEVLTEIGRYHDMYIKLQNPALGELKVSGTFHTGKLNNSLNAIAAILPVRIDYTGSREIVLQSAKVR